MPSSIKTTILFSITLVAYITLGKAPGSMPVRNRDLETSIAARVLIEDRDA